MQPTSNSPAPQTPVASPDRLRPVGKQPRQDRAPGVRLSPHKGLGNAVTMYDAVRDKPPGTVIRGEFTSSSDPVIYFPKSPKKNNFLLNGLRLTGADVKAGRVEFSNFIQSITDSAKACGSLSAREVCALLTLKTVCEKKASKTSDFTVGDVRSPLRILAGVHQRKIDNKPSPHQVASEKKASIEFDKDSLRSFVEMSRESRGRLCDALTKGQESELPQALLGLLEVDMLLKKYLSQKPGESVGMGSLLRRQIISKHLIFFADRWLRLSRAKDGRNPFAKEPWCADISKLARMTNRQFSRQFIDKTSPFFNSASNQSSDMLSIPVALPELPGRPEITGHVTGSGRETDLRSSLGGKPESTEESDEIVEGESDEASFSSLPEIAPHVRESEQEIVVLYSADGRRGPTEASGTSVGDPSEEPSFPNSSPALRRPESKVMTTAASSGSFVSGVPVDAHNMSSFPEDSTREKFSYKSPPVRVEPPTIEDMVKMVSQKLLIEDPVQIATAPVVVETKLIDPPSEYSATEIDGLTSIQNPTPSSTQEIAVEQKGPEFTGGFGVNESASGSAYVNSIFDKS